MSPKHFMANKLSGYAVVVSGHHTLRTTSLWCWIHAEEEPVKNISSKQSRGKIRSVWQGSKSLPFGLYLE